MGRGKGRLGLVLLLLCIKLITYENLLYGTGNSIVLCGDLNGKEIQKGGTICKHKADSLCCIVETNSNRNEKKKNIPDSSLEDRNLRICKRCFWVSDIANLAPVLGAGCSNLGSELKCEQPWMRWFLRSFSTLRSSGFMLRIFHSESCLREVPVYPFPSDM